MTKDSGLGSPVSARPSVFGPATGAPAPAKDAGVASTPSGRPDTFNPTGATFPSTPASSSHGTLAILGSDGTVGGAGGSPLSTGVPVLTGNLVDDTSAISAGTGLKLPQTSATSSLVVRGPIGFEGDPTDSTTDFWDAVGQTISGNVHKNAEQAHTGIQSCKFIENAVGAINRGLFFSPADFCAGSIVNPGEVISISAYYYLLSTQAYREVRVLGLSYDATTDCWTGAEANLAHPTWKNNGLSAPSVGVPTAAPPHGSIVALTLELGRLYLHACHYGGDDPGSVNSPSTWSSLSPGVQGPGGFGGGGMLAPTDQWFRVEVRIGVARDATGWGELLVSKVSGGVFQAGSAGTLTTNWAGENYNTIQAGFGTCVTGQTIPGILYMDDVNVLLM